MPFFLTYVPFDNRAGYYDASTCDSIVIECRVNNYKTFHDEFEIDKYFRFDISSDAADQGIIYNIS